MLTSHTHCVTIESTTVGHSTAMQSADRVYAECKKASRGHVHQRISFGVWMHQGASRIMAFFGFSRSHGLTASHRHALNSMDRPPDHQCQKIQTKADVTDIMMGVVFWKLHCTCDCCSMLCVSNHYSRCCELHLCRCCWQPAQTAALHHYTNAHGISKTDIAQLVGSHAALHECT